MVLRVLLHVVIFYLAMDFTCLVTFGLVMLLGEKHTAREIVAVVLFGPFLVARAVIEVEREKRK